MMRVWEVTTSYAASVLRGTSGLVVGPLGPRPEKHLELYDFEACPFCRKAREALSHLAIDVRIEPAAKGSPVAAR